MKHTFHLLLVLSLLFVQAQSAATTDPFSGRSEKAPETAFDLRFDGGTFDQLLQAMETAWVQQVGKRHTANVMIGERARTTELPPFELYSVTVDDVFNAVRDLLRANPVPGTVVDMGQTRSGIWIVDRRYQTSADATRVFQIAPFLTDFNLEDLTTAIQTAWEMAGLEEEEGRLRFHKETGLLFARGTAEQIELIEQVLEQMRTRLESLRQEREALAENMRAYGTEIRESQEQRRRIIEESEDPRVP